jgi:DNA-binding NtrC family response regulator
VLTAFQWPGNIRQLENALFRAVVLAETDSIGLAEFPQIAAQVSAQAAEPGQSGQPLEADFQPVFLPPTVADESPTVPATMPPPGRIDALPLLDAGGEVRALEELEADLIRYAITHYRGQMSEVARRLKIGRSTLYRKLEGLGMDVETAADPINEKELTG